MHFSQYRRSHAVAMSFAFLLMLILTILLLLLCFGIINIILILLQQQQIQCITMPTGQIQEYEVEQWEYNQPFIKQQEELVEMCKHFIQNMQYDYLQEREHSRQLLREEFFFYINLLAIRL